MQFSKHPVLVQGLMSMAGSAAAWQCVKFCIEGVLSF